ncbi:hypothetical protein Tco_0617913 [Tanacetum coccineum]
MLLTPNLNHPSIVQLSPEYCSGIGCLYHKYLQRSKLIVTASFGWSRGLLEKSALDVCFREYVDIASFSFGGSELVRGASSSHGCSISLEILPYQRHAAHLPSPSVFRYVKLHNIAYLVLVFSTWMTFGGNTRDLGSFGEETDEITDLHQILEEVFLTERGDGVAGIKRRCRDPSGDSVRDLVTASGRSRLNEDLESST